MRASYLHGKALQTLFRGDNRVSVNASEERLVSEGCTVFFYLSVLLRLFCIINTPHVGVDYLIIFYYAEYWGGVKIFLACVAGGIRGHERMGSLKYRLPKNDTF